MKITTQVHRQLSDTLTPLNALLAVRERYPVVLLLESSDYQSKENSYSFLAFEPLATFETGTKGFSATPGDPDGLVAALEDFRQQIVWANPEPETARFNGLFGYAAFEAVRYFDTCRFDPGKEEGLIPDLRLQFFRFLIVFDHFNSRLTILENLPDGQESQLPAVISLVNRPGRSVYAFRAGRAEANMSDAAYRKLVEQARYHCQRGDVFQLVLSRRYRQAYTGDDINLYRALRAVNPSPYLFYFDYGDFRIMGSSPEAQLIIRGSRAEIHPIAGTIKRTGDDEQDHAAALALAADPKENAEHNMLVDLARNDLARSCRQISVSSNKVIQYFSHVIHLVSRVVAEKPADVSPFRVFADTFPAGTLSGAPKLKALELINRYEPQARGFYGGAIGYISLAGDLNMAITIRSVLARNNRLYYQAGAGIVIGSEAEKELAEVASKLGAIRAAIELAEKIPV